MSLLEADSGQKVLLPTEKHDFDNNAESDNALFTTSRETEHNIEIKDKQNINHYNAFIIKMLNFLRELVLMIIAVCVYAAMVNDTPKVSKSPVAYPFFPKESVVTDWYRGEISLAIEEARKSDIAFVMFYAPWDAKSQDIRLEFEIAARHMQGFISFTAINCWQPDSECHQQYRKVYNWPVLIAYPTHGRGIQYNGVRNAQHMVKFLTAIMSPLIRIDDTLEIPTLLAVYDAVILAEVNGSPGSHDYAVYYSAALRFLEKDPFREIAFALITTTQTQPLLNIHMWNETLIYPSDKEWKTESILSWIYKYLHQPTMWISPAGTKSQQLSTYIQSNPAIILFTPRNPLMPFVDYYDLFKSIALSYFNCENQVGIGKIQDELTKKRQENILTYNYYLHKCDKKQNVPKYPSVVSISKSWPNDSSCSTKLKSEPCLIEGLNDVKALSDLCNEINSEHMICNSVDSSFQDIVVTCNTNPTLKTSMLTGKSDAKSMKNLRRINERKDCALFQYANKLHEPIFEKTSNTEVETNVTGLACTSNETLRFIAMDSLIYHNFAERLSVDLEKDSSAVILVNEKMETHHVLRKISAAKLKKFIYNFTINQLPRAFYRNSLEHKNTHVYPILKNCGRNKSDVCVKELDSRTFLPTVLQMNKAVVVFYHSKQCSFCNGMSYVFLNIANTLSSMNNLKFARIDGDLNNLPWEYTMDEYPTILYFPPFKKSESRVFPSNTKFTIKNLLNFLLINMEPSMKIQAMWIVCNTLKFDIDKSSCMATIRIEILSLINRYLKLWRNGNLRERNEFLYKLQQLRNLHLSFAHSPNDAKSIMVYLNKLHKSTASEIKSTTKFKHAEL